MNVALRNFVKNIPKNIFVSKIQEIEINCTFKQIVFAIIILDAKLAKVVNALVIVRLNYEYGSCFLPL